jgi:cyclopropane fatty-acyl-phospholipid synthase-like methyltransferase
MSCHVPRLGELPISKNDINSYEGINYLSVEHVVESKIVLNFCEKSLHINKQHSLLDIGSGTGRVLKHFKDKCNISGLEICPRYYDICRNNGMNIKFFDLYHDEYNQLGQININNFHVPHDSFFDRIIALYVFNHLYGESFNRILYKSIEKLRKNGLMLFNCSFISEESKKLSKIVPNYNLICIEENWWSSDVTRPNLETKTCEKHLRRIIMKSGCQVVEPIRHSHQMNHIKDNYTSFVLIRKL